MQAECLQEEIITLFLEWLRRNRIMCRGNEVKFSTGIEETLHFELKPLLFREAK